MPKTPSERLIERHVKGIRSHKPPNIQDTIRRLRELEKVGIDIAQQMNLLNEYRQIERSDFKTGTDYNHARFESWLEFDGALEDLEPIPDEEIEDDEDDDELDDEDELEDEDEEGTPKPKREPRAKKPKKVIAEPTKPREPREFKRGGVRARFKCPLCGMVADLFDNRNPKLDGRIPSLMTFPHDVKTWRMQHGGFKYNPDRGRMEGIIEYEENEEALIPTIVMLLKMLPALAVFLHQELINAGAEIEPNLADAQDEIRKIRIDAIWAAIEAAMGDVDDPPSSQ